MYRFVMVAVASAISLSLLAIPASLAAQQPATVTVELAGVGDAIAAGTAALTGNGPATDVELTMTGLDPNASYGVRLHGGSCEQPSASAAALPDLVADAAGSASATGRLRFQDRDDIALSTIADGEHVLIVSGAEAVACGTIPAPRSTAGALISGSVPPGGGLGLVVFGGGSYEQLVAASGCLTATARFWATVDGRFVVLVPASRVAAVNAPFDAVFRGSIPSGTALVGTCPRGQQPPQPEPQRDGPPLIEATAGGSSGPLGLGAYCWAFALIRPHVCQDAALTTTSQVLTIAPGQSITITGIAPGLQSAAASVFARPDEAIEEGANRLSWDAAGAAAELTATTSGSTLVLSPDLPAGRYLLSLSLQWGLGGAVYGLQFDIS